MNYYCVHSKGNFINQPNMRLLFLLLFCSVLCAHAQVSSRSDEISDSSFISYRLEGEPAHRLFLHKDTLRVEVKGNRAVPALHAFVCDCTRWMFTTCRHTKCQTDSKKRHRHGLGNICFAGWKMPEAYFRQ